MNTVISLSIGSLFLFLVVLPIGCYSQDTTVQYVHLAFTGDPTEMVVGYFTQDETSSSTVKYGLTPGSLSMSAQGNASEWLWDFGYDHFVILTDLTPDTTYYFVCGDSQGGWSSLSNFTTAPNTKKPFSIAVYGDMGIDYSQNTTARLIAAAEQGMYDWVFHVGDISYADDHVFWFQDTWNTWFENVEPISSRMAYMVGPGNHEYCSYDPFLYFETRNFVVYNHRFLMPGNPQAKSMYYSFDYSNVHFVSYSTETSFPNAPFGDTSDFSDEVTWLIQDLATANLPENRKAHPWIIVAGHRPIYSSTIGYSEDGIPIDSELYPSNSHTLQSTFEEIFAKYKVDLVFNGHVHSYERNYPAFNSSKGGDYNNPEFPFNIVIGCAGNIEGLEDPTNSSWNWPQPEWSAHRFGEDFGYGILDILNDTHLHWTFYRAGDGGIEDEIDVYNNNHY